MVEKSEDVCGGVIPKSGSKRFCCKPNCEAKSHKKTKLRFTPNSLYVRGTRSGQARVEPCIQIHELPDDVDLDELLKESKSLDVWGAYFDGLKGVREDRKRSPSIPGPLGQDDEDEELSWDRIDAPTLEDICKVKKCFKTPKRLKMGPFLV